jgi:hypothetical protein
MANNLFVYRAQSGGDSGAANPVGRAFIGNGEAPASSTSGAALRVAAVSDGTRAGDHDHSRARTESGFQRDLHVTHDFNFPRNYFGGDLANALCNVCASSAGGADAGPMQLPGMDAGCIASPLNCFVQRLSGSRFPNARDVAGPGSHGGEN